MTPEIENAIRSQGCKCVDEIRQAMKARPKPKWNSVVPHESKNNQVAKATLFIAGFNLLPY